MKQNSTVKLFAVNIGEKLNDNDFNRALSKLPKDERLRLLKYVSWKDQLRSLIGALMIREILSRKLGLSTELVDIYRDSFDRPNIHSTAIDWLGDFNISHCGEWTVLALCEKGKIGLDIEKINDFDFSVVKKTFTEEECKVIWDLNDPQTYFCQFWTVKEAFLKMIGKGLSLSLKETALSMPLWKEKGTIFISNYQCKVNIYNHIKNYKIAICSSDSDPPEDIEILSRDQLI